jgi:PTS system mannose-specific IIC component
VAEYVITRPLVAGLLCGLVLGDVPTGILIGVAVQGVFIGDHARRHGPNRLELSYLGIPLAMVAGAASDVAVSLAVGFVVIGVAAWRSALVGNAAWAHLCDRYAEAGDLQGIIRVNYLAQIGTFVCVSSCPFRSVLGSWRC